MTTKPKRTPTPTPGGEVSPIGDTEVEQMPPVPRPVRVLSGSEEREALIERLRGEHRLAEEVAERAYAAGNRARGVLEGYRREHRLRAEMAHAGVDRCQQAARAQLDLAVRERFGALCRPDPVGLTELAGLFVASSDEFSAALHGIVDTPPPPGSPGLSPVTAAEFVAEAKRLQVAVAVADREAQAAAETAREASGRLTDAELGRPIGATS